MRKCLACGDQVRLDGEKIYNLRVKTRSPWEKIGKQFNVGAKSAIRAAQRFARKYEKPWPIPILTTSECAYRDRAEGMTWKEISIVMNLTKDSARRTAHRYAQQTGSIWPPGDPDGYIVSQDRKIPMNHMAPEVYAYRMKHHLSWSDVAKHFNIKHTTAYCMAKEYAKKHKLPWDGKRRLSK